MSTTQSRGVTVAEVLIAGALLLAVTAGMAYVLRSNYEFNRRMEARLQLNQQSLLALSRLRREISESNLPTVRADATTASVIFPSPRNLSGTLVNSAGDLAWAKLICYRLDSGSQVLYRQQCSETQSAQAIDALALTPVRDLGYFQGDTSLPSEPVADGVLEFEVQREKRIAGSVELRLSMERKVGGREYGIEVTSSVTPRN